jgi:acyl-homoserine lactone acylase PvdQ
LLRRVFVGVILATLFLSAGAAAGVAASAGAAAGVAPSAGAAAGVPPYGQGDLGNFHDILPPGQASLDDGAAVVAYEANHNHRPAHWTDQEQMYSRLTTAAPHITTAQIGQFFKNSTFGVPPGDVASVEHPAKGVTIERDKAFGVPHIYGTTRAALEFGIGWASAEDRLFMMDVLRHVGEGTLGSFAGGSNVSLDETSWTNAPYTPQDLQRQITWAEHASPYSAQILSDARNYVRGINAYIKQARSDPLMMPGEYPALGYPMGPKPFTVSNLISIASIIGAELGNGGGNQLQNAVLYEAMRRRFGTEHFQVTGSPAVVHRAKRPGPFKDRSGYATFESFVDPADPEAPTTVHGHSFPYQTLPPPSAATRKTIALPDYGSVRFVKPVVAGSVPSSGALAGDQPSGETGPVGQQIAAARTALLALPRTMSNALLVGRNDSRSHHPLAVMGPQVSYFSPEILMEEDIHGPGISAEGASFPGTNMYVELGHGDNYAWSATSAGQNIIDTFALPLCNPTGGRVSETSEHYLLHGRCVQMQTLRHTESWHPNIADSTPAGSVTFQVQRTAYGLVIARARIHGHPVAYTNLRSTYMHELDSVLGFYLLNNPSKMTDVESFFNAAYNIDYTFNWFFANPHHIAYYNSGLNPVRARHTDPLFPAWAHYAWRGYHGKAQLTPGDLTEDKTHIYAHPYAVDQPYLTSWNNKQAPGFNDAATGQEFSSVYRSQLLDLNIRHYLRATHDRMTLADLINAMGNAGTQDLRGVEVLPYALKIIGHPGGTLGRDVSLLRAWVRSGAHRINRRHPGTSGSYQNSTAVRLMDAWWPLLVRAEFQPVLGPSLLNLVESDFPINDPPGHGAIACCHVGSSWDVGFYGIVQKDLRAVLGERVRGSLNRIFCGRGSLARCRRALTASLLRAAAESPKRVYPADSVCSAGNQMCADSIQYRSTGVIGAPGMEWINRPTFQQADVLTGCPELIRHGRPANVCPGGPRR